MPWRGFLGGSLTKVYCKNQVLGFGHCAQEDEGHWVSMELSTDREGRWTKSCRAVRHCWAQGVVLQSTHQMFSNWKAGIAPGTRAEYKHRGSLAQLSLPRLLKFCCSWFAQTFSRNRLFIHFAFFLVVSPFSATPALEEFYCLLRKSNSGAELCTAPGALCSPWAAASH